jgi:hypothetical protein
MHPSSAGTGEDNEGTILSSGAFGSACEFLPKDRAHTRSEKAELSNRKSDWNTKNRGSSGHECFTLSGALLCLSHFSRIGLAQSDKSKWIGW